MKQQLRHLKLFELGIAEWPYQTSYEEMKKVVDDKLNGCVIKTSDEYPDSYFNCKAIGTANICYVKDDRVIMEQDLKNDRLYVRFDGFWSVFSNEFSLEYTDIQAIIKILVEQHLKCKVGTPLPMAVKKTR